jgi:hypothetical protein
MKKKIIFLVLCAVLLLMFTSSSYGGFDPNYMEREEADPWEHQLSPTLDHSQDSNLVLLIANPGSFLIFRFPPKAESRRDLHQSPFEKSVSFVKRDSLSGNEAESRK